MRTVRQETEVRSPPIAVFSFLDEAAHLRELIPHLTGVSRVDNTRNRGCCRAYRGRILGLPVSGNIQEMDYQKPSRIVWRLKGHLSGTIRWYVSPLDSGRKTRFTYAATYRPPGPRLLRSVVAPVIQARMRNHIERVVQDIKKRVE